MINWPNENYWTDKYSIVFAQSTFAINGISTNTDPKNTSLIFSKVIDEQILNALTNLQGLIIITKLLSPNLKS